MSVVELLAALFGVVSVVLTARQSLWCWPTGLVMVVLYAWVFWQARLYADMGLQLVYVGLQLYGWWQWARGGPQASARRVQALGGRRSLAWLGAGVAGGLGLGLTLAQTTDAAAPLLDSQVTALSLVAQWLMSHKVLECWAFWILVDVLAVGVFASRGLWPTTALYAVFLGLATAGGLAWRRELAEAR